MGNIKLHVNIAELLLVGTISYVGYTQSILLFAVIFLALNEYLRLESFRRALSGVGSILKTIVLMLIFSITTFLSIVATILSLDILLKPFEAPFLLTIIISLFLQVLTLIGKGEIKMSETIVFYDKSNSDTLRAKDVFEHVHKDKDIAYIGINSDSRCDNGVHYYDLLTGEKRESFSTIFCLGFAPKTTAEANILYKISKGHFAVAIITHTEINYNPDIYSFICINKTDTTTYDLVVDYIKKGELND